MICVMNILLGCLWEVERWLHNTNLPHIYTWLQFYVIFEHELVHAPEMEDLGVGVFQHTCLNGPQDGTGFHFLLYETMI